MLKYLDAYTLRARLAPAVIASAPAFSFVALAISWAGLSLSNAIATIGLTILLFALSDLARSRGKQIEPDLFTSLGGKPTITMLRHRDNTFDAPSKDRYLRFLASKLGEAAPTEVDEQRDPAATDRFYDRCGTWLRENTRNTKKFSILFNENVTYGYRRNLYALKWAALILNLAVVVLCIAIVWNVVPAGLWGIIGGSRPNAVFLVAGVHALYIGFAVNRRSLEEAARSYARQLILSCEVFFGKAEAKLNKP